MYNKKNFNNYQRFYEIIQIAMSTTAHSIIPRVLSSGTGP